MKKFTRLTMFDLIRAVQDTAASDEEVVAVLAYLLNSKRVLRSAA